MPQENTGNKPKNILFIMTDDHARQAITAYAPDFPVETPGIDRIAKNGMRMDACYCTNSICAPSRAAIVTGTYNHLNGVRNLEDGLDGSLNNVGKVLQKNGYQTAILGKWHLGDRLPYLPVGFDETAVFVGYGGQGSYYDPEFAKADGSKFQVDGYATDIVHDMTIEFLENRDKQKPFFVMCHHKAPHRNWVPNKKYEHIYDDVVFPHPPTYNDDFETRGSGAAEAIMDIDDLRPMDFKLDELPEFESDTERRDWKFQHYMRDYMACVKSVDDSVAGLLDYLDENGLSEDTLVIYTSDQGFYTGEHGWFDKRFMYEESHCMPFLAQMPGTIPAGQTSNEMILNIDFADLFLDYAGVDRAELDGQGRTFRALLEGDESWKGYDEVYYRYWDYPSEHNVYPHFGIRTRTHKLMRFEDPTIEDSDKVYWELYDIADDPLEINNIANDPANKALLSELKDALFAIKLKYKDDYDDYTPSPTDER